MEENETLKEWREKVNDNHLLSHNLCELEFEWKGYKKRFEDFKIPYKLIRKIPLGKNPDIIGLNKLQYEYLKKEGIILVIGIMNKFKVDEHLFFVYKFNEDENNGFKSGYDQTFEYIHFRFSMGEKTKRYLKSVEEFLDNQSYEKENGKQSNL